MFPEQLQSISEYIKETTEALYEWDLDKVGMEHELTKLHTTIKTLMDATFEEREKDKRALFAYLEMQARKCRECCLRRLNIKN